MRRRQGFTLVEMLVAMALTMFIMVILSQAFATGLQVFGELKAIGDMQEGLRAATNALRDDLAQDHFEGKGRLSNPTFYTIDGRPTNGFLRIIATAPTAEGADPFGIATSRSIGDFLQMSVKRRGNRRENFFSARVPAGSPLLTTKTTFFDQPNEHRFQEPGTTVYNGQWAEISYALVRTGTTVERNNPGSTLGTPLHALYRIERVVVPDNSHLNWAGDLGAATPIVSNPAVRAAYGQMSCREIPLDPAAGTTQLYFNNPSDLTDPAKRSFNPAAPDNHGVTYLLSNVISFQVKVLRWVPPSLGAGAVYDTEPQSISFDSATNATAGNIGGDPRQSFIRAIVVTLRVWDMKTQQSRQVTLIQDM